SLGTTVHDDWDWETYPGAAQAFQRNRTPQTEPVPSLQDAKSYMPEYLDRNCQQKGGQEPGKGEVTVCEDVNPPENPAATIILAGGSHAGHIEAAFQTLAQEYD